MNAGEKQELLEPRLGVSYSIKSCGLNVHADTHNIHTPKRPDSVKYGKERKFY